MPRNDEFERCRTEHFFAFLCVLGVTSAFSAVKVFLSPERKGRKLPTRRTQIESKPSFVIVWEFRIQSTKRRAFERAYGPEGDWAKFFRKAKAYFGTELIQDTQQRDRYLTIDYWESRKHYEDFKKQNRSMYQLIDVRCEALTSAEFEIGQFNRRASKTAKLKRGV
jgi:heme-degrading monooxygenase HmoA